jgi:hypothetical protein
MYCSAAMKRLRIATLGRSGGRGAHAGRFATPADSPRHECSPNRGLHARRERLGFVRTLFCRPVPNLSVTIRAPERFFSSLVSDTVATPLQ